MPDPPLALWMKSQVSIYIFSKKPDPVEKNCERQRCLQSTNVTYRQQIKEASLERPAMSDIICCPRVIPVMCRHHPVGGGANC